MNPGARGAAGAALAEGCLHVPGERDDKYLRGVVALAVGSEEYPGAGVLAALGAQRAGVGMARLHAPRRVEDLALARIPGLVCSRGGRHQVLVAGCGVPEAESDAVRAAEVERLVRADVGAGRPVVLDAGALGLVPALVSAGVDLTRCVLTPHPGEASRLGAALAGRDDGAPTRAEVEDAPAWTAAWLSRRTGATVVLKQDRVHVARGGVVLSCGPGSAWAAVAGAGDVLAGVVGAFLARAEAVRERQGCPPSWWECVVDAGFVPFLPVPVVVGDGVDVGAGARGLTRLAGCVTLAVCAHQRAGALAAAACGKSGGPVDPVTLAEVLPRAVGELVDLLSGREAERH